jgi:alcohol-forming fatty acyl-CoA reductase
LRLQQRLDGRHALVTGVTGFVGEALLQRLLSDLPGLRLSVLVRPKGPQSATDRLAEQLGKPIFAELVEQHGGVDRLIAQRLQVLVGDLADVPALPADLDLVVHCAGDVSFDPPIQQAFETNVNGTERLLGRVSELGTDVHYVHVSTAYVAGRRRGVIPEQAVEHSADRAEEARWGMRMRDLVEEESRLPERLRKTRAAAEREHRRAGYLTAAADTERRRREWVDKQLVAAGAERARSLGWTDAYTFTKALGERAVEEHAHRMRCSIVRPSIIESALEHPYPGWIEGFKMAEPLILAYGRGELPEFPAAADSVVDIVPVDQVVGCLVAVMAHPPEPGAAAYFHISSGARNPLSFQLLYETVRAYFQQHPFDLGEQGAVPLPAWRFPGGDTVARLLSASERAHRLADYAVTHAPRSDRTRDLAQRLDRQQRRLEFLRRYIDLYFEYAQAELQFDDSRTLALFESLEPDDRALFGFDTARIDWRHYLGEVHCPAVTEPLRQYDVVRRQRNAARRAPAADRPLEARGEALAAFDMDGTLLSSNVIETYLWTRLPELDPAERAAEVAGMLRRLPGYLRAERRDRGGFLRAVYRRYAGAELGELERLVDEVLAPEVLARVSAQAVRRVREHRAAGHRTVLITGAIRPLTRPLAPLFDDVVAADLAVGPDGRCTGHLCAPPLVGESRAAWLRHHASRGGYDLVASFAYADSHSDLPMLEAVGNPVAVSPDVTLLRAAKRGRWPIVDWQSSSSESRLAVLSR